jgi:hypothetical protein
LGQHLGIDLVGLDLGAGDCLGEQRVGHHHLGDVRLQHGHDRPGVGGRFHGHTIVGRETLPSEVEQRLPAKVEAVLQQKLAGLIEQAGLHDAFVDIETDKANHGDPPLQDRG